MANYRYCGNRLNTLNLRLKMNSFFFSCVVLVKRLLSVVKRLEKCVGWDTYFLWPINTEP